jgi:teichuronic acid biosynthesis glycosyltransferase TuaH
VRVIGPVTQEPPAGLPGSVHVLGPVDYDEVPDHLARARVGIVPMSLDPQNAGRSPMKYYEYLAAGLQVVARRTPALAARGEPGTWLYSGTDDGVDAVRQALDSPGENAAGREGARRHDWSAKASELLDFVGTVRHVAAR